jgi:hypothetical protein
MAIIPYTEDTLRAPNGPATVYTWSGLKHGDEGAPVEVPTATSVVAQFAGDFDAGNTVATIQGCVSREFGFAPLSDRNGVRLSKSGPGVGALGEVPRAVRPVVNGGAGNINISLLVRG